MSETKSPLKDKSFAFAIKCINLSEKCKTLKAMRQYQCMLTIDNGTKW